MLENDVKLLVKEVVSDSEKATHDKVVASLKMPLFKAI